jgi:chemotaxis methyl-accepting protein methylase
MYSAWGDVFMHKLMALGTILEHELTELRLLVERQTGIVLDCPNSALAAHVADYVEAQDLGSSATLLERLRSSDQDFSSLSSALDGLVNTNTGFFRHQGALNALAKQVVPQLCARKSVDGSSPLRIWSAGCATGEETYSIAMAVCDAMNQGGTSPLNLSSSANTGNGPKARSGGIADSGPLNSSSAKPIASFSVHIVGSDLLSRSVETADRGVYPQSAVDGLPVATIRNYFSKVASSSVSPNAMGKSMVSGGALPSALTGSVTGGVTGGLTGEDELDKASKNGSCSPASNSRTGSAHLIVKPRLRSLVTFNCMNLARPGYIGRFDIIFCMDVLPHMSRAQRIALIERLHLYLEPGGYLFLSQTEKLISSNLNFRSETFDGYTYHRKPLAASAAYGR